MAQKGVQGCASVVGSQGLRRDAVDQACQLHLCPEDVGLGCPSDGVLLLGNLRETLYEVLVARVDEDVLVNHPQVVVGLGRGGDGVQLHAAKVLIGHVGVAGGHGPRERPLAGEGNLLRKAKDIVVSVVDPERLRGVPGLIADHGIVVGGDLGGPRLCGAHAITRSPDVRVVVADLRNHVGQHEPLGGLSGGGKDEGTGKQRRVQYSR